ncbi:MAG: GIVxVP protein [Cyanobacteriota bacterium]
MSLNRTAKGIVLVPALLLGGAFLSAAVWGEATETRPLALGLGLALLVAGLLAQWLPEPQPESEQRSEDRQKKGAPISKD